MTRSRSSFRGPLLALALLALLGVVALPALAAGPPANAPAASDHPGKGPKASKAPEVAVTLRGVISATTDADGDPGYSLTVDGKTVRLEAGPAWYYGDKHPFAAYVGKTVTITGGQRGDEVDVETVDGVRIRAEGKPPWAGGWKAVGSAHPGWSQDKWDRWLQHQADKAGGGAGGPHAGAGCWPPGHCKEHGPEAAETPDPNGG